MHGSLSAGRGKESNVFLTDWLWLAGVLVHRLSGEVSKANECSFLFFYLFYFIFKLYITVLVLQNIKMNPPQVYMCSPSRTPLPPPSPFHPSGLSQCTSPKHPVSYIEPLSELELGQDTRFQSHIPFLMIFYCCSVKILLSLCFWEHVSCVVPSKNYDVMK